jgi:hypothetical protein
LIKLQLTLVHPTTLKEFEKYSGKWSAANDENIRLGYSTKEIGPP